jgi:hypothetical protein
MAPIKVTSRGAGGEVPATLGSWVAPSCRAVALQQPSDRCAGATEPLTGTLPFLTPAAATASKAWSLVAEEGEKLHAMDGWIDRRAQAQVANEGREEGAERRREHISRTSIRFVEGYFKSNSQFFCVAGGAARLHHRMAWPAGEGFRDWESEALPGATRPRRTTCCSSFVWI